MRLKLTRDLAPLKEDAKSAIDRAAEIERLKYITNGAGQQMAYQQKYAEAVAYMENTEIELSLIPHLVAEVGVTGPTIAEVAGTIIDMRNLWLQLSALIEHKRLSAKKAVDEATTPAQITSATEVNWATY